MTAWTFKSHISSHAFRVKFRLEELYKWHVYPDLNDLTDELNIQHNISWVKAERRADVGHAVVGRQRLRAGESGTPTFVVWQTVIIIHFCSSNCRGFWNFWISCMPRSASAERSLCTPKYKKKIKMTAPSGRTEDTWPLCESICEINQHSCLVLKICLPYFTPTAPKSSTIVSRPHKSSLI